MIIRNLVLFSLLAAGSPMSVQAGNDNHKSASGAQTVTIDASTLYQTLEGWGSSLCWWAAQVGNWDEKKVDEIVDLLTSPDKLNMNIFRYNIGGGDDPSHLDGHMLKGKGKRAEMEGFKASPSAPYNWDADNGQRTLLLKIKEKRPDAVFEAFSNSAPYWMTYSGCAAGNEDPRKDNLKPEYYEAFCDYLLDVCKHYKDKYGISFKTLEPFNEPLSAYWNALGSQEGCHFDAETQMTIIRMLYPKLKASGLKTVISASDETCLEHFLITQKKYRDAGDIWDKLGQLNTHTYSGTNKQRHEVRELMSQAGKPFWQSETGPSGGSGLESNLLLTQKLFDDMRHMRPQAWLDWQIMEEWNNEWCVLRGNFKTQEYNIIKNFYVRMQITRFFRQGCTFVRTDCDQSLAAISPDGKQLVLALLNTTDGSRSFSVNLSGLKKKIKKIEAWRTGVMEDCVPTYVAAPADKVLNYESPAMSLTTFVVTMK